MHVSRSVSYRTIKLFFIGNGERGKTTLLRRLRALPNEAIKNPERTTGIDIEEWVYSPRRTGTLGRSQSSKNPVQFLAWDFAGQVSTITIVNIVYKYIIIHVRTCQGFMQGFSSEWVIVVCSNMQCTQTRGSGGIHVYMYVYGTHLL